MCSGGEKRATRFGGVRRSLTQSPRPQTFPPAFLQDHHCCAQSPLSLCTFELTHNSQFCPIPTHSEQFFPHFGGLSGVCLCGDKQSTALFAFPRLPFRGLRGSRRCVVRWFSGRLAANSSVIIRHVLSQLPFLERRENGSGGWPFWDE